MEVREFAFGTRSIIRVLPESFGEKIWWENSLSNRQRKMAIDNMLRQYYRYGIKKFSNDNLNNR